MEKDVSKFYLKLAADEDLKNRVKKLRDKYPNDTLSAKDTYAFVTQDLIPFARSKGYNFSFEDYARHLAKEESHTLSPEELFATSGGANRKVTAILACCSSAALLSFTGFAFRDAVIEILNKNDSHHEQKNIQEDDNGEGGSGGEGSGKVKGRNSGRDPENISPNQTLADPGDPNKTSVDGSLLNKTTAQPPSEKQDSQSEQTGSTSPDGSRNTPAGLPANKQGVLWSPINNQNAPQLPFNNQGVHNKRNSSDRTSMVGQQSGGCTSKYSVFFWRCTAR